MKVCHMRAIGAIALTLCILPNQTNNALAGELRLAQNTDLGCRQTNLSTGVYIQPDLTSTSQGLLEQGEIVRLEATGRGWARITQPLVGWVESRYLSPDVPCEPSSTIANPPDRRIDDPPPPRSTRSPSVKVTCDVLPAGGLIVRTEPVVSDRTYLATLPTGSHEFAFTRESRVTPDGNDFRRWVYITAPTPGWITLGLEGAPSNLGGNSCG
jgi:hypothetical protein